MKKFFAILLLVLVGSVAASAQTAVDPEYKAEMAKILASTNAKTVLVAQVTQMFVQMPSLPIKDKAAAAEGVVNDIWADVIEIQAGAYIKYLTIDDLRALNEFFATPVGKKYSSSLPLVNDDCLKAMSAITPKITSSLMKYVNK